MKKFQRSFTFPGFNDYNELFRASFAELEHVYEMEKSLTIKQAYRLSWKALHPHSIERQNVKLAFRIFNEKYTLIGVIDRYITSQDDCGGIFIYCNKCDTEWHLLLIKAIGCFVNVLLNDFSINKTNQNVGAKVVRKLSKLN